MSEEARDDIRLFDKFLPEFNGVALIPDARWGDPDAVLVTDACLVGCGGVCEEEFFQSEFPVGIDQSAGPRRVPHTHSPSKHERDACTRRALSVFS